MTERKVTGFGPRTADKLHQMARQFSTGRADGEVLQKPNGNQVGFWLMKSTSIITAADYNCFGSPSQDPTPGSGSAVIAYRDQITNVMKIHNETNPLGTMVYSTLTEAIPLGWFFFGRRDLAGTIWVESVLPQCESGSGGSGGSGAGSGSGCIDVVTDVRFDVYTCQLIVCTRNICFPPGTIIGPEDCGGSGSGG